MLYNVYMYIATKGDTKMIKNLLVNMGVIRSFHSSGRDLLEVYLPFVEYGLAIINREYIDIDEIQLKIQEDCSIKLPINTLRSLLKKLHRQDKVQPYESYNKIKLTYDYKIDNLEYIQKSQKVNRDKNKLVLGYKEFTKCNDMEDEKVMEMFFSFMTNSIECTDILDDDYKVCELPEKDMVSVSDYFIHIKNYDDYNYNTFRDIYFGFLLCNMTLNSEYRYIYNNKKVRRLEVFLDSNFIFRILHLQNHMMNIASYELLELMKEYKFNLNVFSETIDEVRRVLTSIYDKFITKKYPQKVSDKEAENTEGVIGAIYRRKLDLYTLKDFIEDIDNEIETRGINIIDSSKILSNTKVDEELYYKLLNLKITKYLHSNGDKSTYIDIDSLKSDKLDFKNSVLNLSAYTSIKNKTLTDIKIIKYVTDKRRTRKFKFAECEAIFLTCDNVLFNFNFAGHSSHMSIPEVISEDLFTNVLWMYNPDRAGDIPLDITLSIFQSSKYIRFEILNNFNHCIKEYTQKVPESEKYIGDIYSNQDLIYKLNKLDKEGASECVKEDCYGIIADYVKVNKEHITNIEGNYKSIINDINTKHTKDLETAIGTAESIRADYTREKAIADETKKEVINAEIKRYKLLVNLKTKCRKKARRVAVMIPTLYVVSCTTISYFAIKYWSFFEPVFAMIGSFAPPLIFCAYLIIKKKELNISQLLLTCWEKIEAYYYKKEDFDNDDYLKLEERYGQSKDLKGRNVSA